MAGGEVKQDLVECNLKNSRLLHIIKVCASSECSVRGDAKERDNRKWNYCPFSLIKLFHPLEIACWSQIERFIRFSKCSIASCSKSTSGGSFQVERAFSMKFNCSAAKTFYFDLEIFHF